MVFMGDTPKYGLKDGTVPPFLDPGMSMNLANCSNLAETLPNIMTFGKLRKGFVHSQMAEHFR